jgi:16S rRNA (guanine966-N2)-methyltransferase
MSERVRGGLFGVLGDINGLQVLDGLAGSGALGFEAVSRGALSAVLIEQDHVAQAAIAQNITQLGLSKQIKLIKASAAAWLKTTTEVFDIVLLDPPYDSIQQPLLEKLATRAEIGGVIVLSLPPASNVALVPSLYSLLSTKSYGDAVLHFYRRIA